MENHIRIRQKVGQLMVVGFNGTTASEDIIRLIKDEHVGSIILFARNIGTPEEVLRLNVSLQQAAYEAGHSEPLIICIDQENGVVRRLGTGTTLFPGQMTLGATNSEELTLKQCQASARELKLLGVNMNLAPVLDVNNNPQNPVIGVRSFGEDPNRVSKLGVAAIHGYQTGGVITCGKHFPGHGDTDLDSHLTLPTIEHGTERLELVEYVPFRAAIDEGVDSIMIAHVCFPAIESDPGMPATVSHNVVTGLLRGKLAFEGVITTDCLEMNAISQTMGTAEGALAALKAGVDLLMVSHRLDWQKEVIDRIVRAVEEGELPESRLDESIIRVRQMKQQYLSWEPLRQFFNANTLKVPTDVGCLEHQRIAKEVATSGVTVVKRTGTAFVTNDSQRVLVIAPQNGNRMMVEDERYAMNPLAMAVQELHQNSICVELEKSSDMLRVEELVNMVRDVDSIIVGTLDSRRNQAQIELIKRLKLTGKPVAVIAMRGPYDIMEFPEIDFYIAAYEFTPVCVHVAVQVLFGQAEATGRLPVSIPGLYPLGWSEGDAV